MQTLVLFLALCGDHRIEWDNPDTGDPAFTPRDDAPVVTPSPEVDASPALPPVSELWFYTQANCPPCRTMEPIVDRIEASGVTVHRIDCTGKAYDNVSATPLFRFSNAETGRTCHPEIVGLVTEADLRTALMAEESVALAVDDAAPTPYAEVIRCLSLLPAPGVAFVDYGCGADARWCVAAAEKWDCKCYGIEIDPARAAAARRHVEELGLDDRIEIIEGNATEIDVDADVGAVYLYPETIEALRPKLEKLTAFVSYLHDVPGLSMSRNGESFVFRKAVPVQYAQPEQVASRPYAVYGNQIFYGPCCNNGNCQMRAAIMQQLRIRRQ